MPEDDTKKRTTAGGINNRSMEKSGSSDSFEHKLIADTYKIGIKIGSGSYGQIRLGTNVKTGQTVAIKFEPLNSSDQQLKGEYLCYQKLAGKKGFPTAYYHGRFQEYEVLVLERLGRNLETLYDDCGRRFTLKSVLFLALQLLKRFETLHSARIIYRDVKPENFMLGTNTNTVFIIDFGLSKHLDKHSSCHTTNELIGTSRYMSINAHLCREQSRRDDLEALGYVFIYFLRGKLPWSGLKAASFKEHNQMIVEKKRSISAEELCDGHPQEFLCYLKYVRSLDFDAEPNYEKLRNMFKRRFHLEHFRDDGIYDWNKLSEN
ncbi:hypothetical protein RDWZM_004712 [Blomia tropicalis]|uniref:non-specific serine/threonine protein kinase n=1 Tax=Blomia tropicalis TaxID=40697 RepID=A0A9Q0M7N7_BLOTA|nr:Casein kinase I isoform gamma-2 [Blomia tropicalis]KAJ6218900.1 hypothetical protein RDWZM_004712 [Blomia tropicalis]